MAVQTPVAIVLCAGCAVGGLLAGVWLGRKSVPTAPAVTAEVHAVRMAPTPAPGASATLTPTTPPAPTETPRVVAPTESDVAVAQRLAGLAGPDLATALCRVEQQANPEITFAALERNAARFDTQVGVFRGKVLEIQDIPNESGSFLRLGLDSWGQRVIAVITYVRPPDTVVRGRRVKVYGRMANTFAYTSQAGWNITIPRMNAVAVVRDTDAPRCPATPR